MAQQIGWWRSSRGDGIQAWLVVGGGALAGLGMLLSGGRAQGQPCWKPLGKSEPGAFYYPNAFADPVTGEKVGWFVPGSTKSPKYGMWQNQEHAILPTAADRWTVVAMETNRAYLQFPGAEFIDAYKFMEYDNGIVDGDTLRRIKRGIGAGTPCRRTCMSGRPM